MITAKRLMVELSVLGVPTSLGSYAAGQDQAPGALRAADLIQALIDAGIETDDAGDLTEQIWATDFEREHVQGLGIHVTTQAELIADPQGAATRAVAALPAAPFVVHVDVDVLDFIDAPLAENISGRNIGPTLDQVCRALTAAIGDPRWRGLSIGEINPTRSAGDPAVLPHFIRSLADVLATTCA